MSNRMAMRMLGIGVALMCLAGATASAQVLINEVAWAGTAASANDEWIELRNTSEETVDLTGWTLRIDGSVIHLGEVAEATLEVRRSTLEAGGYFLLERTDDTTVSDIEADLIYKGGLSNGGEDLFLIDPQGATVDEVLAAETGWPAGTTVENEAMPYASMERLHPPVAMMAWGTNVALSGRNGVDAEGNPLLGTPGAENSLLLFMASVPRVEVLGPPAGAVEGTVTIEWSATDPDGEDSALRIRIVLRSEGDNSTETLVENLANVGTFLWDTTEAENGTYTISVFVADAAGFTAFAAGPVLEVSNTE